jgi:hypothetical protein
MFSAETPFSYRRTLGRRRPIRQPLLEEEGSDPTEGSVSEREREMESVWRKDESRGLTGTDNDTHDRHRGDGKSAERARATVGLARLRHCDKAENGLTRLF